MKKKSFTYEEVINFLAKQRIYPVISKKGRIFFIKRGKFLLSEEEKEKFLKILDIKDMDSLRKVREEIKEISSKIYPHTPIKKWIKDERPRELLIEKGSMNLPLSKLFAIILRTGNVSESAEELALKLLNKYKTLRAIDNATIEELCEIDGIGIAKATQIKAALEIGKRFVKERAKTIRKIRTPKEAILYIKEYFSPYLRDAKKEYFIIVLLDIKNKPIRNIEISKGSINASIVDPKEIVKEATLNSASSVILLHNHPSGEVEPSEDDLKITKQIVKALEIVDINVLDHIIIGKNYEDFFSFKIEGLI